MQVKVEKCWIGNNNYKFRLTLPNGDREFIACVDGEAWQRKHAIEAKNLIQRVYNIRRSCIRFT